MHCPGVLFCMTSASRIIRNNLAAVTGKSSFSIYPSLSRDRTLAVKGLEIFPQGFSCLRLLDPCCHWFMDSFACTGLRARDVSRSISKELGTAVILRTTRLSRSSISWGRDILQESIARALERHSIQTLSFVEVATHFFQKDCIVLQCVEMCRIALQR